MAITNAQQYQQILQKEREEKAFGGLLGLDGRRAYVGGSYKTSKSGPSKGKESGAYQGGSGVAGSAEAGKGGGGSQYENDGGYTSVNNPTGTVDYGEAEKQFQDKLRRDNEQRAFAQSIAAGNERIAKRKRRLEEAKLNKKNLFNKLGYIQRTKDENLEDLGAIDSQGLKIGKFKVPSFITGAANAFTIDPSTKYFDEDSIREIGGVLSKSKTGITKSQKDTLADLKEDIQFEDRVLDPNDTVTQSEFNDYMNRNKVELPDNDGGNQVMDPCKGPNPPAYCFVGNDTTEEDVTPTRNLGGLAPRFAGSIFDFTGLADGGRAGAMDGGRMMNDDDPVGGIMDLETSRQMYGLGKLVKKITRGVKKVVKSPVGKAALLYFGGNALMNAGGGKGLSSFFGKKSFNPFLQMMGKEEGLGPSPFGELMGKLGLFDTTKLKMTGLGKTAMFGIPSIIAGLTTPKDEDDTSAYDKYREEMKLNMDARNRPFDFLSAANQGGKFKFAADGGIMRNGYAEGSEEPVAKKTMPLLDMDGQEMDLREEGGFVPLGRMERADDVPARLSKNEFVFTADAVRNAGEGDVDKGAEVMYNMMKNLESGGEVSEESQGLDGAREMFKTSQRLEEVI